MNILIIGADGLLGHRFKHYLHVEGFSNVFSTTRKISHKDKNILFLDIRYLTNLKNIIIEHKVTHIINCAGYTNVDNCEKKPEQTIILNFEPVYKIGLLCNAYGVHLTQISTDQFLTTGLLDRTEQSSVHAFNQYGRSKLYAEKALLECSPNSLILRTNFFGISVDGNSRGFFDWLIESGESKAKINCAVDYVTTPISIQELIKSTLSLQHMKEKGIYNVVGSERISKFDFATLVFQLMNYDKTQIIKGRLRELNLVAKRINDLSLPNSKLVSKLGYDLPSLHNMILSELKLATGLRKKIEK